MSQTALVAAAPAIDDLEQVAARLSDRDGAPLLAAARHLRAIDQTISDRATERGAHHASATDADETAAERSTDTAVGNRDR